MQFVFVLIRLPFFVGGLDILTAIYIVIAPFLVAFWLGILILYVLGIPIVLIIAALENDSSTIGRYLKESIPYWFRMPVGTVTDVFNFYGRCTKWLLGIAEKDKG